MRSATPGPGLGRTQGRGGECSWPHLHKVKIEEECGHQWSVRGGRGRNTVSSTGTEEELITSEEALNTRVTTYRHPHTQIPGMYHDAVCCHPNEGN